MAKTEMEEVTNNTVRNGGVLAKMYFDMQSEKSEDLQPLMADLINNRLLKSPGVVYCYGMIDEPIKLEKENVFSTSATITALFKDLGALINVTFGYIPAAVEILKPEKEYILKTAALQSILVDLAKVSTEYTQYILSRTLSKEDMDKVTQDLKNREALGKRMLDDKKDGKK